MPHRPHSGRIWAKTLTIRLASPTKAIAATRRWRGDLRHALRVTLATIACFAIYQLFDLPQGYWAVFTVVIVMQASIGATLAASLDRLAGTVAGALLGGVAAAIRPHTTAGLGAALGICVAITAFAAAVRPNLRVAPVTAVIMLLSSTSELGPLRSAFVRIVEIAIGSGVGLLATLLIFPARSKGVAAERSAATLNVIADLLARIAERLGGEPLTAEDIHAAHDQIRAKLSALESAMNDAEREHTTRLGQEAIPRAVLRTLWRIRNDAVVIGRAAAGAFPDVVRDRIVPGARNLLDAEITFARACAAAVTADEPVHRADVAQVHDRFEAEFETIRRQRLTRPLSLDEAGHVFALAFALEGLYRNLADLADRLDEVALRRARS